MKSLDNMYWKWKSMIIDFNKLSKELCSDYDHITKAELVFYKLGIPDELVHHWENGVFTFEYNEALKCALELGLVEKVEEYK